MARISFSGLRIRLLLLVLLAVVPALGMIIFTAMEQRQLASAEMQEASGPDGISRLYAFAPLAAAYRIVQEALTNVARHAGVNEVKVPL